LHMRHMQHDPPLILGEILWLNFHETLNDNHGGLIKRSALPFG
jgi:hypothetical protein